MKKYIRLNFKNARFYIDQVYASLITAKRIPELIGTAVIPKGNQWVNNKVSDIDNRQAYFKYLTKNGPITRYVLRNVLYDLCGLQTISTFHNSSVRRKYFANGGKNNEELKFIEELLDTAKIQYYNPMVFIDDEEKLKKYINKRNSKGDGFNRWLNNCKEQHPVFEKEFNKIPFTDTANLYKKWLLKEGMELTLTSGWFNPNIYFTNKEKDRRYKTPMSGGKLLRRGCGYYTSYDGVIQLECEDTNLFLKLSEIYKGWSNILDNGIIRIEEITNYNTLSTINGKFFIPDSEIDI